MSEQQEDEKTALKRLERIEDAFYADHSEAAEDVEPPEDCSRAELLARVACVDALLETSADVVPQEVYWLRHVEQVGRVPTAKEWRAMLLVDEDARENGEIWSIFDGKAYWWVRDHKGAWVPDEPDPDEPYDAFSDF